MTRAAVILIATIGSAAAAPATLPDALLTPGAHRELLERREICATRWGLDARLVTPAMRRVVFSRYGLAGNGDASRGCGLDGSGRRYEIDHRLPRSLGGADVIENLWPQCYSGAYGAVRKDRLEVRVSRDMCAGRLTLDQARMIFLGDWRRAYRRYFGRPK